MIQQAVGILFYYRLISNEGMLARRIFQEAYEKAGAAEKFKVIIQEKTGHSVSRESMTAAVEWFKK